jgi:FAD/FMN-containing dehydrogenase
VKLNKILMINIMLSFLYSSLCFSNSESPCKNLLYIAGISEQEINCEENKKWKNFGGTVLNTPAVFIEPKNELHVVKIVKAAVKLNWRVRPIGSGHSWSKTTKANQILMGTHKLVKPIIINRNPINPTFTTASGMILKYAVDELQKEGYALSNLGSMQSQTFGGVVSTNTHGTGIEKTGFAGLVTSLRLVDGLGNVHILSKKQNPNLFYSALSGAGMVGIITELTLKIEKDYYLSVLQSFMPIDVLFDSGKWKELLNQNEWFSMLWPIHEDSATLLTRKRVSKSLTVARLSWTKKRKGAQRGFTLEKKGGLLTKNAELALFTRKHVTNRFISLMAKDPDRWEGVFNVLYRFVPAFTSAVPANYHYSDAISDDYDVEEWDWNIETEVFFPIEFLPEYIKELKRYSKELKKTKKGLVAPFVGLRFVKGDHSFLSPTYIHKGYDKFVAVTLYDHSTTEYTTKWFSDNLKILHEIVNDPTLIRMHLGKIYHDSEKHFEKRFFHWDKFKQSRLESDPKGIFLNQWTEKFFN